MVANLLSHSNLFAAGIARSGAYNRTLLLWIPKRRKKLLGSPDVYYSMSPLCTLIK